MPIHYFTEEVTFALDNESTITKWLLELISEKSYELIDLNYIFCSDDYLLNINREHLNHDYYTDIITFDNSESFNQIESDIFISIDRIKENAHTTKNSFENELYRVMAHGLLHLFGFKDKTDEEKKVMREKEDHCLSLLEF